MPSLHFGQAPPPQSMSVSAPSWAPSVQLGTPQTPLMQSSGETQSLMSLQSLPLVQGAQVPPPQSTSDSSPFWTPSVQVGSVQTVPLHQALSQSSSEPHVFPSAQVSQSKPPQSTSLSEPFFLPSKQVPDEQVRVAGSQMPPWQSPSTLHFNPSAHFGQ